jgi:peptidoglycan/LPS O-acetylase OafA/YrhL
MVLGLQCKRAGGDMSFSIYLIGFAVLIIGLGMGAYMLHVPPRWIGVGVVVLIGIGILSGVSHTRRRDPTD